MTNIIIALAQYVFNGMARKENPTLAGIWKNPYLTIMEIFLTEGMVVLSILTARFSGKNVLISTQVGTLIQYFTLAFFFLMLGRLKVDIFDIQNRDQAYDWIIYFTFLVVMSLLYLGSTLIRFIQGLCNRIKNQVEDPFFEEDSYIKNARKENSVSVTSALGG